MKGLLGIYPADGRLAKARAVLIAFVALMALIAFVAFVGLIALSC